MPDLMELAINKGIISAGTVGRNCRRIFMWLALILILAIATVGWINWHNFSRVAIKLPAEDFIFTVERGVGIGQVAYQLEKKQIIPNKRVFRWMALITKATKIKAGEYKLTADMTQDKLLRAMVAGDVVNYGFTIVEGWNFQQLMMALRAAYKVTITAAEANFINSYSLPTAVSEAWDINPQAIDTKKIVDVEGLFWPDTYYYTAGTSATTLLQRANKLMQTKLQQMWQERAENCKLDNMYAAVILASIIEKETRLPAEYAEVSGVYQRRLQQQMRLQADPTVIYALSRQGEFKPPLSRENLTVDSPYNTYKNVGLPPTPIAIPGERAVYAALHPADGKELYFVADGNGGHVFSVTLAEHVAAVKKYVR